MPIFPRLACVLIGLWGGCIIGFITEYFTSSTYQPVRDVARSTETGAATNIIYGLALGYKSAIVPVMIISVIGDVEALQEAFGKSGARSGGGDAYDSDEEGGGGGRGGVQCAHQ